MVGMGRGVGFVSTILWLIVHNVVAQISGATEMTLPVHDQLHILQTLSSFIVQKVKLHSPSQV